MNTDFKSLNKTTEKIIGRSYKVANTLGCGFFEKVYENALVHELKKLGLNVKQQERIIVNYDGIVVGEFMVDIIVDHSILVEVKAVSKLTDTHVAQCLNYLKASGLRLCLLINFGNTLVDIKRYVNH